MQTAAETSVKKSSKTSIQSWIQALPSQLLKQWDVLLLSGFVLLFAVMVWQLLSPPPVYTLSVAGSPSDMAASGSLLVSPDHLMTADVSENNSHTSNMVASVSAPIASLKKPSVKTYAKKPMPKAPVHINSANAGQLQQLPGVGPAMAQKIMQYRQSSGGFKTVDELLNVSGIGPKKFAKMQPFITL